MARALARRAGELQRAGEQPPRLLKLWVCFIHFCICFIYVCRHAPTLLRVFLTLRGFYLKVGQARAPARTRLTSDL